MIRLTMTEEQAKIVSIACEFYARVRMGQFNEIVWNMLDIKIPSGEYCERRERAEQLLLEARKQLYPDLHGAGHSYGIGKFIDADMAFDVHQVIRHEMGDERPPFSYHSLPICERVELPSSEKRNKFCSGCEHGQLEFVGMNQKVFCRKRDRFYGPQSTCLEWEKKIKPN